MKDLGVLVVVDDRSVHSVIERLFGHFKARIDCALSATEALECLKNKNYRAMITNMGLPELDGIELARVAQELFPTLNVILFSSYSSEQIMNLVLAPNISDMSEKDLKPCSLNKMLQHIKNEETGRIFLLE